MEHKYLTEAHRINSERAMAYLSRPHKVDVQAEIARVNRMHEDYERRLRERAATKPTE